MMFMDLKSKEKVVVIVGTTASGKTVLAVDLAYKFNGEIISADSRQVYKYMDIGTGKDLNEYQIKSKIKNQKSKIIKIPYHCIDLAHPNTKFDLAKWHKKANNALSNILKRCRIPIIAGGTGLYTQALVDGYQLSKAKPDNKLRGRLEKLSEDELYKKLLKINKKFANRLNESDKKNKRRLIRYIEIGDGGQGAMNRALNFNALVIGLTCPKEILQKRIMTRLTERLDKEDMIGEVERLHKEYRVSWKRLLSFGLEYKYVTLYLRNKTNYDEMVEQLARATYQFSRRQMAWLRRWERQGREIHWVKNKTEARRLVKDFIKK